ncbi:facilitated trehalose transporter Tret1-like isoform X1 [Anastrepha obliqua]|uniref:facilitated trehalose transporter Tret1-like isoform X1 n=2 Tax=Anastrepha obliqua TaxID=95512 RepID=UPI002408FF29|nr:facilitated trehalose transporter Tret1-like isoform X1 [Anastrepha obliqua]
MSSQEQHTQVKYSEVSPFQISDGFSRSTRMEPVKTIRIFMAAVAANLSAFAVGTCLGWTSPVGPKLKAVNPTDSPLDQPITTEDDAWISSILALGALVAPFIAGPLADKIGRKWVLLSSSIFFVVAYVFMMLASEVWMLLVGRLIQGFGVGFVMTVQPMYVGEIATDAVRGATGSLMQLFIVSGILYVYAVGAYVSYMTLQWCCIVIPIIFDVIFYFMPESPYYYAGKGQKSDALNALQFLRGQSPDIVQDEMAIIQGEVEESMANKGSVMDIVKSPGTRKALIISAGLIMFQQLSGINVVLFNSQSIFESADTGLDSAIASIIVGGVQVGSSALTPIIADRLGRKVILLISAFGMCVGLAGLGAFFYVQQVVGDASNITWLPVPALVLFNIVYCIGFGPLPWAVLGEMFPANVKSIASSIVASTCWILGFVVTRWYPALDALGSYYAFWMFAVFCVVAFFFTLFVVMETKGLSLQEIQDRLNGKKPN